MLMQRWARTTLATAFALAIGAAGLAISCEADPPPESSNDSRPSNTGSEAATDLSKTPADALAVLEKFVGQWQTETQLTRTGPPVTTFNTKGRATCERTLGGRYFEFRAETVPPGQSDLQVMTFDAEAGVYRQWVFSSDGYQHEATGTWNPATSTLRWTGKSANTSFVIDDHWVSADRLEWILTRADATGRVVQTITGTVSRAKSSE